MALNNRANAYLSLGDRQKALADVEKALQVNPEYQRAQETKNRILGN
jgi:Tfp pilus assembly protein PilF